MARRGPHRALFGSDPERIGNAAAGPLVVGREGNADVAVVENAIMLAVCLFDLIERLGDQESADAITGHEGKRTLEEVQTAERRELVEHHQKLMLSSLRWVSVELLGKPTPDLIENEANEWLCTGTIRRVNDKIRKRLRE